MRGPKPLSLPLTSRQKKVLEQITRRATSPQGEVRRARIILMAAEGKNNQQIADRLSLATLTARTWRKRWVEASEQLQIIESNNDEAAFREAIHEVLRDDPRSGAPSTFTPEQICQIVAVGCERPADSGRPISHWTPTELAAEVVKRGLVPNISPRSVGRFLKVKPTSSPISRATG
jgi:putative transposase